MGGMKYSGNSPHWFYSKVDSYRHSAAGIASAVFVADFVAPHSLLDAALERKIISYNPHGKK